MLEAVLVGLSSELDPHDRQQLQKLLAFWECVPADAEGPGETHWGVLAGLKAEFEELLGVRPLDLNRLASLTAEGLLELDGRRLY